MKIFKFTIVSLLLTAVIMWFGNLYLLRNLDFIYLGPVPLNTLVTKEFKIKRPGKYRITLKAYNESNKHDTHNRPEFNEYVLENSQGLGFKLESVSVLEPTTFQLSGSLKNYCSDCEESEGKIEMVYLYIEHMDDIVKK